MNDFDKKDFGKILKHQALDARRWMKLTDSTVARVYDRNLEAIPVTVELYGSYARIVDFSDEGFTDEEIVEIKDIVARYLYVETSKVIFRERKKRERGEQHEKGDESVKLSVKEYGLEFEVELGLYADTGIFLDQTNTRAMVMESSSGRKVLNLFCYTSSFSVYAAAGGAESVVSVDLSNVYSAWSRRNLDANGFLDQKKYSVVTMDASAFLDQAIERGDKYDLVIFDPPAFSNSHKAEDFDVQKDYLGFLSRINMLLVEGGAVVFSENLQGFRFEKGKLGPYFKVREITGEVHAQGFSKKRKSCRVWILEKTADMQRIERAVRKKKNMDELKDASLDRLTLSEDGGKTREKRERRSSSRSFSFDEKREGEREERPRREGRRDTHQRDHERRRDRSDRRESSDERRSYRDRDDRRSFDRDERRSFRDRDDRRSFDRDERRSYRDRDDRRSFDRDERRSFRDRDDRRSFDRDDRRPSRDRDERRSFDRDERRSFRDRDERRSFDRDDRRSFGRDERRFSRDRDERRPFDREERRFSRDGENETSRFYRGDRGADDRAPRRDGERRKKNAPKPYGYDSFMATKNREKATAYWLQGQEGIDNGSDE